MKKLLLPFVLLICLLFNAGMVSAHALYIDTSTKGKIGESQEVRVYYSEFEDRKAEKVADWYSDVAAFQLWLIHPDGEKTQLNTTSKEDHFVSSFTPEKKGAYRLEISHIAEDPGEETAYQFNAFAQVFVGKSSQTPDLTASGPDLVVIQASPDSKAKNVTTYKTYFKGEPKEGIEATLFLPSGGKKTFVSNATGVLELTLEEKGTYFLEATSFHKDESGETKKSPYKSVWRCATQKIEVL